MKCANCKQDMERLEYAGNVDVAYRQLWLYYVCEDCGVFSMRIFQNSRIGGEQNGARAKKT